MLLKTLKRGGLSTPLGQKLGFFQNFSFSSGKVIYVRAVSVGEVRIAQKLIDSWSSDDSDAQFVLAVNTATGYHLAQKKSASNLKVVYSPLDISYCVKKSLDLFRPSKIIFIESDIWFNFIRIANKKDIPLIVVDARVSPASQKHFLFLRRILQPFFSLFDKIYLKDLHHMQFWQKMGVHSSRLEFKGSIKYDLAFQDTEKKMENFEFLQEYFLSKNVVFAVSTHSGEESWIASAILKTHLDIIYFVAPRHIERCKKIQRDLSRLGLNVLLFSDFLESKKSDFNVILIDTTGNVPSLLPFAKVAVMGKSFLKKGGQNPVEPISAKVPLIFGPHMSNFQELARELLCANAVLQVDNQEDLSLALINLLQDTKKSSALVNNADKVLGSHYGSTFKIYQSLIQ